MNYVIPDPEVICAVVWEATRSGRLIGAEIGSIFELPDHEGWVTPPSRQLLTIPDQFELVQPVQWPSLVLLMLASSAMMAHSKQKFCRLLWKIGTRGPTWLPVRHHQWYIWARWWQSTRYLSKLFKHMSETGLPIFHNFHELCTCLKKEKKIENVSVCIN